MTDLTIEPQILKFYLSSVVWFLSSVNYRMKEIYTYEPCRHNRNWDVL